MLFRDAYRLYATRPRLAVLFAHTPISSAGVLEVYQQLAEKLMSAGVDARETALVLDSYAIRLGVEHAAPSTVWQVADLESPLARAAAAWPEPSARVDEAFERGLRLILDHVESIIAANSIELGSQADERRNAGRDVPDRPASA